MNLLKTLEELEAKAKVATRGPWKAELGCDMNGNDINETWIHHGKLFSGIVDLDTSNNAQFIAAANPETIVKLCETIRKLVDTVKFYATLKDRNKDEPFLRREFGCGCCAGENDSNGDLDYDGILSDVCGLTASECLKELGV